MVSITNKLILTVIVAFLTFAASVHGATYYINQSHTGCSDAHSLVQAQDPATPWCSLSSLNNISSGDTIYICNGTYRASSSAYIIQDKVLNSPTIITRYPTEQPYITAAMSEFETVPNSRWTHLGDNIYKTISAYSTGSSEFQWVDHTNTTLMSYGQRGDFATYEDFKNTSNPIGLWYNDSGAGGDDKYLIRYNSTPFNPNATPQYIVKNNQAILNLRNITGSAALIIRDLTFTHAKYGIITTLDSFPVMNLSIENNRFLYMYRAIEIDRGGNITIYNNTFKNNFQSDWFWRIYKSDLLGGTQMEGDAIKSDQNPDSNLNILNNSFEGTFNGVYIYTTGATHQKNTVISGNYFTKIYDDAIEVENYANNITITNNLMTDCFVGLSLAPADSNLSRSIFSHNVVVCGKRIPYYSMTSYTSGKGLKLERTPSSGSQYRNTTNWTIMQNTFIIQENGKVIVADDSVQERPILNSSIINNILWANNSYIVDWTGLAIHGVRYDYNVWHRTVAGSYCQDYNTRTGSAYSSLASCRASPDGATSNWDNYSVQTDPLLPNYLNGNYTPDVNSPVCRMSSIGSYVGAIPCPPEASLNTTLVLAIYNESSHSDLVTENMTLEVINHEKGYSTLSVVSGGLRNFTPPRGEDIELRYGNTNHYTRSFFLNTSNDDYIPVSLFALQSSLSNLFTVVVRDSTLSYIHNATVIIQRWYSNASKSYTIAMARTNTQGRASFWLEYYNAYYKIIVVYKGKIIYDTGWITVVSSPYTITAEHTTGYTPLPKIDFIHKISNTSTQAWFILDFTKKSNDINEVCLDVYQTHLAKTVLTSTSCSPSTSATISTEFNKNLSHTSKSYAVLDSGATLPLDIKEWVVETDWATEIRKTGFDRVFFIMFWFAITFLTLFFINPHTAIVSNILLLIISKMLGFINWHYSVIITFAAAGVVALYYLDKK